MEPFGFEHLTVVAVIAIVTAWATWAVRRGRLGDRTLRVVGWLLLVTAFGWLGWSMRPSEWDGGLPLPLNLSDWLRIITALALITRAGWTVVLSYYWGLTLNLQALLTPDLAYSFNPALEFAMFWFSHGVAFIVPIVLVVGVGLRPTWRGFGLCCLGTLVWAGITMTVNALLGVNYGYLMGAPESGSALDLMGPWPWYLLTAAAVLAVVWAVMTWPWVTAAARERSRPAPSRFLRVADR